MPKLVIPPSYRDGLVVLQKLDTVSIDRLVGVLQREPSPSLPSTMATAIETAIPQIDPKDAASLSTTILSLYSLRSEIEESVQEVIAEIIEAMQSSRYAELRVDAVKQRHLGEMLTKLLSVSPVELSVKRQMLVHDFERVYHGARILTDVRPIFDADATKPPRAAAIVHSLRISYHEGSDLKSIYITIDADDLAELEKVVERAKVKAGSLRDLVDSIDRAE